MRVVYLSLLGAAFLPFAKPLIALLTVLFVAVARWRLNRSYPREGLGPGETIR